MRWQVTWLSQECGVEYGADRGSEPKVSEKGIMNRGHSISKGTEHTHTQKKINLKKNKILSYFKINIPLYKTFLQKPLIK